MITDSFDINSEAIISPESFRPRQFFADTAILTFSHEIIEAVLAKYPHEQVSRIQGVNGQNPIWLVKAPDLSFILYMVSMSSTMAATDVIELNCYTGPDKFIMFGSAGALDHGATKGRFVIPTEAYRDEGMSYHYAPPADYIRIKNADKLAGFFEKLEIPYVLGRVWTTDAMYRETRDLVRKRREEGCIAVEMELAGVQAVCDFHGFELYDFLQTGDVVDQISYTPDGLHEANHSIDKFEIALQIAKMLHCEKEDKGK